MANDKSGKKNWILRVLEWCENHIAIIIAVITIIAAVVGRILESVEEMNYAFMNALLIIIAVDLILIVITYLRKHSFKMDHIEKFLEKSFKAELDIDKKLDLYELSTKLKAAENEIFIVGLTCGFIAENNKKILEILKKIPVTTDIIIILHNPLMFKDNQGLCRIFSHETNSTIFSSLTNSLTHLENLKKARATTKICYTDIVVPVSYIGIDVGVASSKSMISAEPYTFKYNEDGFAFNRIPGTELYQIYADEIKELRELAKESTDIVFSEELQKLLVLAKEDSDIREGIYEQD